MTSLAITHAAINLSQVFPDFNGPDCVRAKAAEAIMRGPNQYAPSAGIPVLRRVVAQKMERFYGLTIDPETEVTVTSGATEALFCAIQAFVHAGDEVIVFDPAYDSYEPATRLAGGRTVHLPLMPPSFSVDWQRVREALTPRTRMIVLNSPHNPTGAVLSREDLDTLAGIVRDRPIVLLSDEGRLGPMIE